MAVIRTSFGIILAALAMLTAAQAQYSEHAQYSHIDFGVGGGFTEAMGRAGNNVDTGWNFDIRGGYKPSPNVALDLDFNYNRWDLNGAAVARYGEPVGYTDVWSITFTPVLTGTPRSRVSPSLLGGPGVYSRHLTLPSPLLSNTFACGPC